MSSSAKRIRLETADTQETTIEKLCDDVLVEIFSYLSAEELKCATLVCKHWNEVIGTSAAAMKKFKLKLEESEVIGRQFRSTRNYQNIELEMLAAKPPSDQKALLNLGRLIDVSQEKYFKIFAFNREADPENALPADFTSTWKTFSIDATKLTSALKQMKQFQELFIECPAGFRGSFTSTIDLPKLTKLVVKSPDASIFHWLNASNVTEIDVIRKAGGVFTTNVQHLASFLKLCKQITTLKLDSGLVRDLFGNGKWKDFNLKLSVVHIVGNAIPDATSLRELLMSQVPSLISLRMQDVSIYLSESDRDSVIKAMSRLKNLKILSLDHRFRPDETFLKHLTELEQLTVYEVDDINSIARFNQKLTYLKIEHVNNSLYTALEFSELKHLYIGLNPPSNCLKLIKGSPRVEIIELKLPLFTFRFDAHRYARTCCEAIKAAMQQPTLRHLKLEYRDYNWNFEQLKKVFDVITSDYGNLKSLSVRAQVGPALRSLEFLFPENRSDWNVDEQKMRLSETFTKK